jgi:hypothetical protein
MNNFYFLFLLQIQPLMSTVAAAPATTTPSMLDGWTQYYRFSTQARNIIDRIINGEHFNYCEPYLSNGELYYEPNLHVYNDGESTPVEIDDWDEQQEHAIDLLSDVSELNLSRDRALLILQVMLCDRSNYYVSEDTICCYFELFGLSPMMSSMPEPAPYLETPITFEVAAHDSECTDDCPICMCEPTDEVFRCSTCKHEVCRDCMNHWLESHIAVHGLVEGTEQMEFETGLHHTCPHCQADLR